MLSCRLCPGIFANAVILAEHLRIHRIILCQYNSCHYYASDLIDLALHLEHFHQRGLIYKCLQCNVQFDNAIEAQAHVDHMDG